MTELIQQNWIFFLIALAIGIAVAWWIFVASRKTTIQKDGDTEAAGEGTRAKRNQALIDASPANFAAEIPPTTPIGMAGAGEAVAAAAEAAKVAPEATQDHDAEVAPPAPVATPAPTSPQPAASAEGDDLTRIKGVGPKLSAHLAGLGISTFAQIAAWDDAEIDRIDAQLGRFEGRIRRDNWPEQARFLAQNDTAGFEAKFGKV
ncbi:hypothetical protein GRI39_08200 [Altererythrobacter indicus]|uniref:Uncharacterized protein n=1 Tax=Altericroceibacterium indicum TaxID=374177 RepID=A0A845A6M3_9SPHN|nr:hypothetical protein [Altericroceibacterium indicum]MXP26022.1 hypothetical protein [Altericroceibacterium indicum]